ncbi:uncharacterized protein Dvar_70660 [Desulfosarcina variabilis str. Montpellier]
MLFQAACTASPWAPDAGCCDFSPDGKPHTGMGRIGLPATDQTFHIAAISSGHIFFTRISNRGRVLFKIARLQEVLP